MQMQNFEPSLIRTWLFGPGMNASIHEAMARSGADALIVDLEDSTPLAYRAEARRGLAPLFGAWQHMPFVRAVRINGLETEGLEDLGVAMQAARMAFGILVLATQNQQRFGSFGPMALKGLGIASIPGNFTMCVLVKRLSLGFHHSRRIDRLSPC